MCVCMHVGTPPYPTRNRGVVIIMDGGGGGGSGSGSARGGSSALRPCVARVRVYVRSSFLFLVFPPVFLFPRHVYAIVRRVVVYYCSISLQISVRY